MSGEVHVGVGPFWKESWKCSCLENPKDRGAWWASVYGVAQSRTRLKRRSSRQHIEKQSHYFPNKGPSSQGYGFSLAMVVMYGCDSWTIKKAEHRRIDAFELWCWRRLLRVPWKCKESQPVLLLLLLLLSRFSRV